MAFLPSLSLKALVVIVVPPCLTNLLVLEKEEDESQVNCLLVFFFVYSLSFHQNLPQSALRRRHLLSAAAAAAAAMESVVETVSSSAAWVIGVTLAIANASFAWVSAWIPVLLVFDMAATSWWVCHSLGSSNVHPIIPSNHPFFTNRFKRPCSSSLPSKINLPGPLSSRSLVTSPLPTPSWLFTSSSSFTQLAAWCPSGGIRTALYDEGTGSREELSPAERWLCRPWPTPTIPGTGSTWGSDPTSAFAAPVTPTWKVGRALGRYWTGCTTARRTRGWTWGASRSLTTIVGGCGARSPWRLRSHTCSLWVGLWSSTFTLWGFSAGLWRPLEPGGRCPLLSWLPEPFPSYSCDSIWEWPFFWRTPRRVREFGAHPDWDLPFGPRWGQFMEDRALVVPVGGLPDGISLAPLPPALRNDISRRRRIWSSED
ncbi:hypothetical protein BDP67DRAFT_488518 [Colletotrichum lupini]|nr:hypothetical protein BDP67DRAFT_488518 [Colletotrichum lupini]